MLFVNFIIAHKATTHCDIPALNSIPSKLLTLRRSCEQGDRKMEQNPKTFQKFATGWNWQLLCSEKQLDFCITGERRPPALKTVKFWCCRRQKRGLLSLRKSLLYVSFQASTFLSDQVQNHRVIIENFAFWVFYTTRTPQPLHSGDTR